MEGKRGRQRDTETERHRKIVSAFQTWDQNWHTTLLSHLTGQSKS
jgi:hypothetical protein